MSTNQSIKSNIFYLWYDKRVRFNERKQEAVHVVCTPSAFQWTLNRRITVVS